jgi:hypothetical protein
MIMNKENRPNQKGPVAERRRDNVPTSGVNSSLVDVDNPDDIPWEGEQSPTQARSHRAQGDDAYVTVDNPDDFE